MSIIGSIVADAVVSIFRRMTGKESSVKAGHEVSLETYAQFPIFLLLENEEIFGTWKDPEVTIAPEMEETFRVAVWVYELYVFLSVTDSIYGAEIADKCRNIQLETLKRGSDELAQTIGKSIDTIAAVIKSSIANPTFVDVDGESREVPVEYEIALEFLSGGTKPLFPIDRDNLLATGHGPNYDGVDWALAQCLEYGKQLSIDYFASLPEKRVRVYLEAEHEK